MNKNHLRQLIKDQKSMMSDAEIERLSASLCLDLYRLDEYKNARCVFAYVSYNQEVRTQRLIERALADGKMVAVPRVYGDIMQFKYISSFNDLQPGYMGIPEPSDDLECADDREDNVLMIMPGLAFDDAGNRVGYGRGYYDRYLTQHNHTGYTKIALAYDFQIVDSVDADAFDVKTDILIGAPSHRVIRCMEKK